jgi:hypothetical protein
MDLAAVPQPPPGQGPVLAYHRPPALSSRLKFRLLAGGIVVVLIPPVSFVLIPGASLLRLGWMMLVALVILGNGLYIIRSSGRRFTAAGAEWYSTGSRWVRIYELVEVTMSEDSRRGTQLLLADAHENEVRVSYQYVRQNRLIWDLVYNGILHSVVAGNADTDTFTRAKLDLPDAA